MYREFKYNLPVNETNPATGIESSISTKHTTHNNSLIIIGANGSGKSKLGAWMEQQNRQKIHRIGAQRSIVWQENIPFKSLKASSNKLLYGNESYDEEKVSNRYINWKDDKTQTERRDIDDVLSAIFAKRTVQLEEQDELAKAVSDKMLKREDNIVDKIQHIWDIVFQHNRGVSFKDRQVKASIGKEEYNGIEMSDGERVALYLISQVLLVPESGETEKHRTIIIDEPEIHLHRSIMNILWTALEKERPDCLFIYITHDTQFAANHTQAEKIWVKSYNKNEKSESWELEKIKESDLPEELLLRILGNRKKVLFVEGEVDSYDSKLYREIYKDYYVIPCSGCQNVIRNTKSMNSTTQLNHLECFGLIDRDYRGEREINSYKENNIFVIKVAEVENLFLVEELLKIVNNNISAKYDQASVEKCKNDIVDKFSNKIEEQILEATLEEIKYQLSTFHISKDNEDIAKQELNNLQNKINFEKIKNEQKEKFNNALKSKNDKQVLSVFNQKNIVYSIGPSFGIQNKEYCNWIIRHLQSEDENSQKIIEAIKPYLPKEIPIK